MPWSTPSSSCEVSHTARAMKPNSLSLDMGHPSSLLARPHHHLTRANRRTSSVPASWTNQSTVSLGLHRFTRGEDRDNCSCTESTCNGIRSFLACSKPPVKTLTPLCEAQHRQDPVPQSLQAEGARLMEGGSKHVL